METNETADPGQIEVEYPYGHGGVTLILNCICLFGLAAAFVYWTIWPGYTMKLFALLNLPAPWPRVISIVLWPLAAISAFYGGWRYLGEARSRRKVKKRVALTPRGILLPQSRPSSEELHIPYSSVQNVEFKREDGKGVLVITSGEGTHKVFRQEMPNAKAFAEFQDELQKRVAEGTGGSPAR